jgi:hypothetical protein
MSSESSLQSSNSARFTSISRSAAGDKVARRNAELGLHKTKTRNLRSFVTASRVRTQGWRLQLYVRSYCVSFDCACLCRQEMLIKDIKVVHRMFGFRGSRRRACPSKRSETQRSITCPSSFIQHHGTSMCLPSTDSCILAIAVSFQFEALIIVVLCSVNRIKT